MERTELRRLLQQLLETDLARPLGSLDEGVTLREGLGLDSVALINLIVQIQDRLNVFLSDDELACLSRVGDLIDLLQSKLPRLAVAG
jgi:acyl carrier protein